MRAGRLTGSPLLRSGLRQLVPGGVAIAVTTRIARQRILRRGGRTAAFLLEESALRNGFGGPQVMTGQLAWLAQITAWPSVSLGIIPATLDRGEARPVEDFWIFDNEQVAVELVSGHLTITQPREIAMYAQTFARLAEIAVYGARARELLSALAPVT